MLRRLILVLGLGAALPAAAGPAASPTCEHDWGTPVSRVSQIEKCKITATCRTCRKCGTTHCNHQYEGDCDKYKKKDGPVTPAK